MTDDLIIEDVESDTRSTPAVVLQARAIAAPRDMAALSGALLAKFDRTYTREQNGVTLTYAKGHQYITRLNDALGLGNWEFDAELLTTNPEAQSLSVKGTLTVYFPNGAVRKFSQFGSGRVTRGMPFGDGVKGATTDALKKVCTLIGIGNYLSEGDDDAHVSSGPVGSGAAGPMTLTVPQGGPLLCEQCGEQLQTVTFKDNTSWAPQRLAEYGVNKYGKVLCMTHYREAKQQRSA